MGPRTQANPLSPVSSLPRDSGPLLLRGYQPLSHDSAFLLDLEEKPELSSSASLIGFDINPRLFPAAEWLPPRVKLLTLDLLDSDSIPDEYIGAFDVVCARLLVTLFHSGDPSPFLRTASRMLKPGGWLKWSDVKSLSTSLGARVVDSKRKKVASERCIGLLRGYYDHYDMAPEFVQFLTHIFPSIPSMLPDQTQTFVQGIIDV